MDEDSDSSDNFEICIENAGHHKNKRRIDDSENNSFDRASSGGGTGNKGNSNVLEMTDDVHLNDIMNSSGTKR